jgi:hypothetical protein
MPVLWFSPKDVTPPDIKLFVEEYKQSPKEKSYADEKKYESSIVHKI